MAIRAKVKGLSRLQAKLRKIPSAGRKGVAGAVAKSALAVQSDAQRSIQRGARSGLERRKGGRSSAPGEPPKTDTGTLVSSIFAEVSQNGLAAEVGTDLNYGGWLEFGTKNNLAPRPWLQPAFERQKDGIKARVAKAVNTALRQARRK